MWDVCYDYIIPEIKKLLSSRTDLDYADLKSPENESVKPLKDENQISSNCCSEKQSRCSEKEKIQSIHKPRNYTFHEKVGTIVFIGHESDTLTRVIMQNSRSKVYLYNPAAKTIVLQNENVNKLLARRYYLIQRVKDVDRIGICVGTLGVGMFCILFW
jgi:diphthamide biosynthesis enzyme Dph1/Dph2-like protein